MLGLTLHQVWMSSNLPPTCFGSRAAPSLGLLFPSSVVLLRARFPWFDSATGGLLSSLQALPSALMVGPAFSFQLVEQPWHPAVLGYPQSQGVLRARDDTSSSPSYRTWHLKPTDVSWVCMTSSPRMNSSVILAMMTQVVNGHRLRIIVTKVSRWEGCLLLQSAVRTLWAASVGQSCCDIRSRNIHGCSGLDSHNTCFLSYASLGLQTFVAILTQHAYFITRGLEWWNRRLLLRFFLFVYPFSFDFSCGVFLRVFLAAVLVICPTPPHCQQTGCSVLLYSMIGERASVGALGLHTMPCCCIPAAFVALSPPSIVFVRFVGATL
jgi:hypothetical protein